MTVLTIPIMPSLETRLMTATVIRTAPMPTSTPTPIRTLTTTTTDTPTTTGFGMISTVVTDTCTQSVVKLVSSLC